MRRIQRLIFRAAAKAIAFRAEIWLWLILDSAPLLILLIIWQGIYGNAEQLNGVQFHSVIFYYLLVFLVELGTAAHFESWRINEIREGKIDFYLTKPLGYLSELCLRHIGDKAMAIILKIPLLIVFLLIVELIFHPTLPISTLSNFVQAVPILVGAFIVQFYLSAIIVLLGFWLENAEGLDHFRWLTTSLFSGIVIPFAFLPQELLKIAQFLPFKYLHSIPVLVMLGQQTVNVYDYVYLGGFCLGLATVTLWLWQKARKRYSAYGG